MNSIKIKFPNNEDVELELGKPVVLLGANGAGKTRFGVKVEELNDGRFNTWGGSTEFLVHRISAQKSLSISERIVISDNESSKHELYYGDADSRAPKNYRHGNSPATHLLDDYSQALSLLFSEANKELHAANEKREISNKTRRSTPRPCDNSGRSCN